MADVRDALTWVRNDLPMVASKHNISLDSRRVAVIGWSTGGHLAMSTAWTTIEANLEPPQAILNFYGPSDFQRKVSEHAPAGIVILTLRRIVWKNPRAIGYPERMMSMQEIRSHLSPKPTSTHHIPNSESQFAGLCPGDARSELVLETLKADNFVSILLRGMPADEDQDLQPTPDEIVAISPLAQVRKGTYKTPTCIVHGSEDEVLPCRMSQEFGEALASSGVPCEVVVVPDAKHMHDLFLKPGKIGWEGGVAFAYGFLLGHLFA